MIVALYLSAIVIANLVIAQFGPGAAIPVAFVLIGFDLTARDRLHDEWEGHDLPLRMGALIAAGGGISYLLNRDAGQIAIASTVAFMGATLVDAIVYAALGRREWMVRTNGSNVAGAAVDSLLFPTLAFGAFLPVIVLGQFAAKVVGGLFWAIVIGGVRYVGESREEGAPMGVRDFATYLRLTR